MTTYDENAAWHDLRKCIFEAVQNFEEPTDEVLRANTLDWLANDLTVVVQEWFGDHELSFDTHANCIDAGEFQSWLDDAPDGL